jgi:hypothetical protein
MSKVVGGALAVTGFLACPCHLVITLPLLVGVFGGTAIGAFLAANTGLIVLIAVVYFIGALGAGWYLLTREKPRTAKMARPSSSPACCLPVFDAPQRSRGVADEPVANEDVALPVGR